jgi:hypothetical protein
MSGYAQRPPAQPPQGTTGSGQAPSTRQGTTGFDQVPSTPKGTTGYDQVYSLPRGAYAPQPYLAQGGHLHAAQQRYPSRGDHNTSQRSSPQGAYALQPFPTQGDYAPQQRFPSQGDYHAPRQFPPQGGYARQPSQQGWTPTQQVSLQGGYGQQLSQQGWYPQQFPPQGGYAQYPSQQGWNQQQQPQSWGNQQQHPPQGRNDQPHPRLDPFTGASWNAPREAFRRGPTGAENRSVSPDPGDKYTDEELIDLCKSHRYHHTSQGYLLTYWPAYDEQQKLLGVDYQNLRGVPQEKRALQRQIRLIKEKNRRNSEAFEHKRRREDREHERRRESRPGVGQPETTREARQEKHRPRTSREARRGPQRASRRTLRRREARQRVDDRRSASVVVKRESSSQILIVCAAPAPTYSNIHKNAVRLIVIKIHHWGTTCFPPFSALESVSLTHPLNIAFRKYWCTGRMLFFPLYSSQLH